MIPTGIRLKIILIFLWLTAFVILLIIFLSTSSYTKSPWLWAGAILFTVGALGMTGMYLTMQVSKPIQRLKDDITNLEKGATIDVSAPVTNELEHVTRSFATAMGRLKEFEETTQKKETVKMKTDSSWAKSLKELDFSQSMSLATVIADDPEILHHPKKIEKIFLARLETYLKPELIFLLAQETPDRYQLEYHLSDDDTSYKEHKGENFYLNDRQKHILYSAECIRVLEGKNEIEPFLPLLMDKTPETLLIGSVVIDDTLVQIFFLLFSHRKNITTGEMDELNYLLQEYTDIQHLVWKFGLWREMPEHLGKVISSVWEKRGGHKSSMAKKIVHLSKSLANILKLDKRDIIAMERATYFLDIGSIAISKQIEKEAAKLSQRGKELYSRHAELGAKIYDALDDRKRMLDIITAHHERYDGKGMPYGISGNNIPLGARIISPIFTYYQLQEQFPHLSMFQIMDKMKDPDQFSFDSKILEELFKLIPTTDNEDGWLCK